MSSQTPFQNEFGTIRDRLCGRAGIDYLIPTLSDFHLKMSGEEIKKSVDLYVPKKFLKKGYFEYKDVLYGGFEKYLDAKSKKYLIKAKPKFKHERMNGICFEALMYFAKGENFNNKKLQKYKVELSFLTAVKQYLRHL